MPLFTLRVRALAVPFALAPLATLAACNKPAPPPTQTTAATAPSTAPPPPAPKPSAPPVVAAVPSATASAAPSAAPSASASASPSGAPSWIVLGPGDSLGALITTGSNKGCYVVKKAKNGDEIHCPPMASPPASVDDLDVPNGKDCPAGFGVSGPHECTRTCTRSADCHNKNVCGDSHQCVPASAAH